MPNSSTFLLFKQRFIALIIGLVICSTSQAQWFADPIINPFGLDSSSSGLKIAFGDLDGDDDYDILVRGNFNSIGGFHFYENVGDSENPLFDEPLGNPFGLGTLNNISPMSAGFDFGDIDNDGDLDMVWGFTIIENIGNSTTPSFVTDTLYNLWENIWGCVNGVFPRLEDMDNDNDLDLLYNSCEWQSESNLWSRVLLAENIGDENVFTLDSTLLVFSHGWIDAFAISAADIDLDGDIDLMLSTRGGLANFGGVYLENIGSSDTMNFWGGWDSDNFYYSPVFGLTIDPYSSLDFADLDNDGDPDLLVGHSNGTFIYYEYDETLTISDVKKEYEFSIYPNPVNDIIRINIQADIEQIELFDIQGRTVFIQKSNQKEISVNNLSPGIYIIKLKLVDGAFLSDKIVKE